MVINTLIIMKAVVDPIIYAARMADIQVVTQFVVIMMSWCVYITDCGLFQFEINYRLPYGKCAMISSCGYSNPVLRPGQRRWTHLKWGMAQVQAVGILQQFSHKAILQSNALLFHFYRSVRFTKSFRMSSRGSSSRSNVWLQDTTQKRQSVRVF